MYELDKYTVSLLHFDDGFKDETGKVWTANGNPVVSSDQSKFGGKSLYLDGSSYLTAPAVTDFNFGVDDFTIDWWEYRTTSTQYCAVLADGSSVTPFVIGDTYNGNICCLFSSGNNGSYDILNYFSLGEVILNEWVHYAIVRKNGCFYGFQNGKLNNKSEIKTAAIADLLKPLKIGLNNGAPSNIFSGYIDELRISKGIARWTDNFDPTNTGDGKFLLTITLAEEVEREYPVTKNELDAFIKWYDSRANGTGSAYYTFDKFLNRKDYIVYDKILTFEVTDFSK